MDNNQNGFSLIEILVTLFILMIIFFGVYSLILFSLKVTADNKHYTEAINIANQKMEVIRNMPYSDIGVVLGIPAGTIPQIETVEREGKYTINNYIKYENDPYDDIAGSDSIPNDYKIATIKVTWQTKWGEEELSIFSKIIPRTEETNEGYGLLKVYVVDAYGSPVKTANVRIQNTNLGIDQILPTNIYGELSYPALEDYQGYQLTITKTDEEPVYYWGQDQTYSTSTGISPSHLTVTVGNKTEENFNISRLATINVKTWNNTLPDNFLVHATTTENHINPKISIDSADNIYYAWHETNGFESKILLQKYDNSKNKQWGSEIQISTTSYQVYPDIVTSQTGDSYIVWQDNSTLLKLIAKNTETLQKTEKIQNLYPIKLALSDYSPNYYNISTPSIFNHTINDDKNISIENFKNFITLDLKKLFKKKYAHAQSAATIEQYRVSGATSFFSSRSVSFTNSPTAGNVLIAIATNSNNSGNFNTPYNSAGSFTQAQYSNASYRYDIGLWYKIAGAGEPSEVTITSNTSLSGGLLIIMEVSGLDVTDLLDQTNSNDQTTSSALSAYTGLTNTTNTNGFAIAAVRMADNNFSNHTSGDWSSPTSDSWSAEIWTDWSTGQDGTVAIASMETTNAAQQSATLNFGPSGSEERNSLIAVFNIFSPSNISVSSTGTQISTALLPSTQNYIGGKFTITSDSATSENITDITIEEFGSINAELGIENIILYYDLDTTFPYDCASENLSTSSDSVFGTVTDFDSLESATFNDSVQLSQTQSICLYSTFDITSSANSYDTIDIGINSPSTDVVSDGSSTILPATTVTLASTTELLIPAEEVVTHFRWRNDDGDAESATWNEFQDTSTMITESTNIRLRYQISNLGNLPTNSKQYYLQYGQKISTCENINSDSTWVAVNSSGDWEMVNSSYLTDGATTSNSADITDEVSNFIEGEINENSNITSLFSLDDQEFTELEFSIQSTGSVTDNVYCFRLIDISDSITNSVYPEINIVGDNNIYITKIDTDGNQTWSPKSIIKVNNIIASEEQTTPQITLTENFGTATSVVVWQDNRSTTDYDIYAQSFDSFGNKLWDSSDVQITSSSTNEHSASLNIDSSDNVIIAWVSNDISNQNIYAKKLTLNATSTWLKQLSPASTNDNYAPKIITDNSDNIYMTWEEEDSGTTNIYIAKYDQNGNQLWQSPVNTSNTTDNQFSPSLSIDSTSVIISWTDDREGNYDIFVQKFDLNGNRQWSDDYRINVNTGTSNQQTSEILIDSSTNYWSAWEDYRDTLSHIYSTKFSNPSAYTPAANVPLIISGTKKISDTPEILETEKYLTTDASGELTLQVEWDSVGYSFEINPASSSLSVYLRVPVQPLPIMPEDNLNLELYVK